MHAHPDDETIGCGATMAHYAAAGAQVSLLTCTLGELGEILLPFLAGLAADQGDQLGGYRLGELAAAMRELGVTDHRFLGGAGRWRDSGMAGTPSNDDPRAFWRCAEDPGLFTLAVAQAAAVIREVRPQVVVTYNPDGGYGHPDHVMAHRVTTAAVAAAAHADDAAGLAGWQVQKLYYTAFPASTVRRGSAELSAALAAAEPSGLDRFTVPSLADYPLAEPETAVTSVISAPQQLARKTAALRAHATQVLVATDPRDPDAAGGFYALSNLLGLPIEAREHYRLAHGRLGPAGADGLETDLFAGVG